MSMVSTTTMSWGSPGRYIQGPGEFDRLPVHTAKYGKKIFAVIDQFFFDNFTAKLSELYKEADAEFTSVIYNTEVTEEQIEATKAKAIEFGPAAIMGIGGGKTLDTAKAVADRMKLPVIIVPTSASTDAPTSALSVIYNDNHEHLYPINYIKSPDLVLVDSEIIANAPVRFLISGMGDALATMFEAKANNASNSPNYIAGDAGSFRRTKTAMAIAELCYNTIIENGVQAKIAAENHVVTEALEAVIEANTLMSGLGFENTGCAGAHSIGDGITATANGTKTYHGEKVAFGVLCQLVAENAPKEQLEEYIDFCMEVGLPTTLEDLYVDATEENFQIIAENSMSSDWSKEPFVVTVPMAARIVKAADAIGHYYKDMCCCE